MGRLKPGAFVETMCVGAVAVGRQLDKRAATAFCLVDGLIKHGLAKALPAKRPCHAYLFDLRAPCAMTRQTGEERQK
jgi:hypothetical protein